MITKYVKNQGIFFFNYLTSQIWVFIFNWVLSPIRSFFESKEPKISSKILSKTSRTWVLSSIGSFFGSKEPNIESLSGKGLRQEYAKCLRQAGKNLPQENFRVAARIGQILATSLNFLQHTRIFLWVYSALNNCTREILGKLITNLISNFDNFENPTWKTQFGGRKIYHLIFE